MDAQLTSLKCSGAAAPKPAILSSHELESKFLKGGVEAGLYRGLYASALRVPTPPHGGAPRGRHPRNCHRF